MSEEQNNENENKGYDYHIPVLLKESVELLINDEKGLYIDGTLGGGGHTEKILSKLDVGGQVIAFDKDPDAVEYSSNKFKEEITAKRLKIVNDSFDKAYSINEVQSRKAAGILLDLGVSSQQLEGSDRGISYRSESTLDMRFGTEGNTAKDLLHAAKEEELARILRGFGDEPFSRKIARRIVEMRRASSLNTTSDLRKAVEDSVPPHLCYKSLSRVFQAIRIAVNSELNVLQETLANIVPHLQIGGRIVVISYHSLEDKIVKDFIKQKSAGKRPAETSEEKIFGNYVAIKPKFKDLTKKPITPSSEELEKNPRSRSAKLRAAEKLREG